MSNDIDTCLLMPLNFIAYAKEQLKVYSKNSVSDSGARFWDCTEKKGKKNWIGTPTPIQGKPKNKTTKKGVLQALKVRQALNDKPPFQRDFSSVVWLTRKGIRKKSATTVVRERIAFFYNFLNEWSRVTIVDTLTTPSILIQWFQYYMGDSFEGTLLNFGIS